MRLHNRFPITPRSEKQPRPKNIIRPGSQLRCRRKSTTKSIHRLTIRIPRKQNAIRPDRRSATHGNMTSLPHRPRIPSQRLERRTISDPLPAHQPDHLGKPTQPQTVKRASLVTRKTSTKRGSLANTTTDPRLAPAIALSPKSRNWGSSASPSHTRRTECRFSACSANRLAWVTQGARNAASIQGRAPR